MYEFGGFSLDEAERTLIGKDGPIALAPKVLDTLLLMVKNAGRVLSKERMLTEIWEGSFVEENNLAQNISTLRRALGEGKNGRFIETVPKFGYRFVAPVSVSEQGPVAQTKSFVVPKTHYARNGDVNIAYQTVGSGETDIVFVMGWVSHLEYFWKHPLFASFLDRLGSFARLILFDKRGTGLSDRVPLNELPTLEQRMEDVHVVMDAVGSRRAILIGVSEGGPMCSLFAASYPERTAALVMIGTYAKRIRDDDYPWAPTLAEREAFFELMRRDWGKPVGLEERAPSMAADPEFREWWATYLRMGASPGAAVALTKMNAEIDVCNVLPSVRVPTLVIHRKGDMCLKVEEGRYVASLIPNAKFVELEGIDHLPFVGDQKELLKVIEQFVSEIGQADEHDRVLATVMCTQLDPTAGIDPRFPDFIAPHLENYNGRKVSFDSGVMLASFGGPARAIRCSLAIAKAAASAGRNLKMGLHTGECNYKAGKYSGFAVDLAREIAQHAPAGNILASRTVKDLVAGSGIVFEEFGFRSFKGVESDWRLFTVAG